MWRLEQVVDEQEFSAGQLPAEIVVLQQFEYMGGVGQIGRLFFVFGSKENVSGQQLHLIFDDLTRDGLAAGSHRSDGFNSNHRLVDVSGNSYFRTGSAKEATVVPRLLLHTASPSATESAK